jgi:hypothetical protein
MFAGYIMFRLFGKAEECEKQPVISSGRTTLVMQKAVLTWDETGLREAFESLSVTQYFLLV